VTQTCITDEAILAVSALLALIHLNAWKGNSRKLVLVALRHYADSSRRRLLWRRERTRVPHWEPHQAAERFLV